MSWSEPPTRRDLAPEPDAARRALRRVAGIGAILTALVLVAVTFTPHLNRHRLTPPRADAVAAPGEGAASPEVDEVFARFVEGPSPGCAVAVVEGGHLVLARGYGLASLEHQVPITPRTVFDIASISKQFTAAAILLLAERGRLSLDDDVRKYLPELPRHPSVITLRQLIHNTSGLPDYIELLEHSGKRHQDVTTDADALSALISHPDLLFPPGTAWKYSDSGYFLLSLVVQRATGESLRSYADANLFRPLHMTDTQYLDDVNRVVPRRAAAYAPATGGGFQIDQANWQQTGDGAVNTTVLDLAKWDQSFDTAAVGGRPLIDGLLAPGTLADGTRLAYAGGLLLDTYRDLPRVRHSGSWTGYSAEMMRLPTRHLSVITLCNLASADPTALSQRVADIYLDR